MWTNDELQFIAALAIVWANASMFVAYVFYCRWRYWQSRAKVWREIAHKAITLEQVNELAKTYFTDVALEEIYRPNVFFKNLKDVGEAESDT